MHADVKEEAERNNQEHFPVIEDCGAIFQPLPPTNTRAYNPFDSHPLLFDTQTHTMFYIPKDTPLARINFASHTLLSNQLLRHAFVTIIGPTIKQNMSLRSRGAAVAQQAIQVIPTIIHETVLSTSSSVVLRGEEEIHSMFAPWDRRNAKHGGGYALLTPPLEITHDKKKQKTTISFYHSVFNFQGVCLYPHKYCE